MEYFNYSIVVFASTDKGMSEVIIVQTLEHHKWLKWLSLSPSSLAYQGGRTSISGKIRPSLIRTTLMVYNSIIPLVGSGASQVMLWVMLVEVTFLGAVGAV